MNSYPLPSYGRAYCPHCTSEFDLSFATPAFKEKAPHNDILIYLMCQKCHQNFATTTEKNRRLMMNTCFRNFKSSKMNSRGHLPPWSITTTLTLSLNGYDYVAAHEHGHGLSQEEYFKICKHINYEAVALPGGIRMIVSE